MSQLNPTEDRNTVNARWSEADGITQGARVTIHTPHLASRAQAVLAKIRQEIEPVNQRLLTHPYFHALDQGLPTSAQLQRFAGEQYAIMTSNVSSAANMVSRFAEAPEREFFWDLLLTEKEAGEALVAFASALGSTEDALKAYTPHAGAFAYASYVSWLASSASAAQWAAAVFVNYPAWGANCARMSQALTTRYGLRPADVKFFDLFAVPSMDTPRSADFEEGALSVIQRGLDRGENEDGLIRSARLLQAYELMFWDTMYEMSNS